MPLVPIARRIVEKLTSMGHKAYFTGGWVRDFLMQHPSDDIDIATSASVEEVQALFPKTIPVGISFGIVIVVEEGHQFEVATFRQDKGYVDGRRPSHIERATPEEDALRRDFTINGMFFDPLHGEILDFVGGQEDLKKGIIRAIGDPHERFLEDRLRMMRAVRYSTRFDFPIEASTKEAIVAHASSLLPAVAHERIWQEFKKMSQFAHLGKGLVCLHELNLLQTIFPSLGDVSHEEITKRVRHLKNFPSKAPTIAELFELFPHESLESLLQICEYLKLSNGEKEFVKYFFQATHIMIHSKTQSADIERASWAKLYADPHFPITLDLLAARMDGKEKNDFLEEHASRSASLKEAIGRIQNKTPILHSSDLLKAGVRPGVRMGLLLKEAERLSINGNISSKEELLFQLKACPHWDHS